MEPDSATETELIGVLERFCSAFAAQDAKAVMRLFAPTDKIVVITSEQPLLRGPAELRRFLDCYADGPTTYSWAWDRYDVSTAGPIAWLLAEGTETATSADQEERHRYRMTMVLERNRDQWLLRQVHGSSPH